MVLCEHSHFLNIAIFLNTIMMLTILDSFSDGPLDWVKQAFIPLENGDRSALSMTRLTSPEGARELLSTYLDNFPATEHRARVSMWSQWYFAKLLPSWTVVNLLCNWQLPIEPDRVFLRLGEDGLPVQFLLAEPGEAVVKTGSLARFVNMIDSHLAPVCHSLAAISGLKPGLYWNNAAIRVGYGITQAASTQADISDGWALLAARQLDDGRKNPLFEPVRHEIPGDETSARYRKQCCLRNELCDHEICPSCPLLLAEKRKRVTL